MKLMFGAAAAALLFTSPVGAKDQHPKQVRELIAMTPTDHAQRVEMINDEMEVVAKFNTQKSFQYRQGLFRVVWSDIFLRAFVDKTTGKLSIQTYFRFHGDAPDWPRLQTANYTTSNGLRSAALERITSDVSCTGSRYGSTCTYLEDVAFTIDEKLARNIAATYSPGSTVGWKIRFKGQSGLNADMEIMPAEMAGLLMRVDAYRETLGLNVQKVEATGDLRPVAPTWSGPKWSDPGDNVD